MRRETRRFRNARTRADQLTYRAIASFHACMQLCRACARARTRCSLHVLRLAILRMLQIAACLGARGCTDSAVPTPQCWCVQTGSLHLTLVKMSFSSASSIDAFSASVWPRLVRPSWVKSSSTRRALPLSSGSDTLYS